MVILSVTGQPILYGVKNYLWGRISTSVPTHILSFTFPELGREQGPRGTILDQSDITGLEGVYRPKSRQVLSSTVK